MDLTTLRTALLISLSILLVLVLFIRFRRNTMAKDLPALQHAELIGLDVAYHPARLIVRVSMPAKQNLMTTLLSADHDVLHTWEAETRGPGEMELERTLPALADGSYHLELSTSTQRTVRKFRLQLA
ncbi:MAG TPA: hypothetical protein PK760_09650 [Flavobacteriales bacterium]|nr:hypothetical protein [Flavobacteriales bacterium]